MLHRTVLALICVMTLLVPVSQAALSVTNGDFEAQGSTSDNYGFWLTVQDWYEAYNATGWNTFVYTPEAGTRDNNAGGMANEWQEGAIYQEIGTTEGLPTIYVGGLNWWRDDGQNQGGDLEVEIYYLPASSSFTPADGFIDSGTDIKEASGVSSLPAQYVDKPDTIGTERPFELEFDVSGLNPDDRVFLRFNAVNTDDYSFVDDVEIVDKSTATGPDPSNGAEHINPDADLSWTMPTLFPDATADVYFGTSATPPQVATEITATTYDPGTMSYMTTYYWRVDVVDGENTYQGEPWSFTVGGTPTDPVPPDGYAHAATPTMDVSWTGDDWATSYKVYSGTAQPYTYLGEVTETQYEGVPTPAEDTTYYWQVEEYLGTTKIGTTDSWAMTTGGPYANWALDETNVGDPNFAIADSVDGYNGLAFDANTVPGVFGRALEVYGQETSYAEVPALNLNSDRMTIMAWVKPDGAQVDWAGLVFSRDANTTAGISIGDTGGLRYHWGGATWPATWGFNPGLTIADDCWSHTAMTVEPTKATLYLDAYGASIEASHAAEEFDGATLLGRDAQGGRDYKGLIDDVWIYDRPLSASEIAAEYETSEFAKYPDPNNGETGVMLDQVLSWTAGAGATGHNVYFDTVSPPATQVLTDATVTTYDPPGDLSVATWYYWRVDEITSTGTVTGNEWSFETAPPKAYNPDPYVGQSGVLPDTILSWKPGVGGTYTHDVWFGTSETSLEQVATQQTATTYDPYGSADLDWEAVYYWKIDERDASTGDLVGPGDLWFFSTLVPQCNNPPTGDLNEDCKVNLVDFAIMAGDWLVCTIEPPEACPQ